MGGEDTLMLRIVRGWLPAESIMHSVFYKISNDQCRADRNLQKLSVCWHTAYLLVGQTYVSTACITTNTFYFRRLIQSIIGVLLSKRACWA